MTAPILAFSISRDRLAGAMARIAKVVQKRNTIPVLANVLIRAENGTVTLVGTDLNVEATALVDGAAIGTAGAITVPAAEFAAMLAKWPDGPVTIESDDRRMTARIGRSRATLSILPASEFPDLRTDKQAERTFQVPGTDLTAMSERCGFAVSQEETRPYLQGIFVHAHGDYLSAVATDGHRMSRFEMPLPEGAEDMAGVIIPGDTVRLWPHLLGKDGTDPVTIEIAESFIRFTTDVMSLHSVLIYGTYPDYLRVIPRGNNQVCIGPCADIIAAVDRLLVHRGDKRGRAVRFNFTPGEIRLTMRTETAEAEEIVPVACDFELEIAFNGQYLRDMLATMTGPQVRMALSDPGSPCLTTDETDPRRELVIMPMRA